MNDLEFQYPQLLLLLLLLPLIAFWMGRRGRVAAVEYSSANVAREVARESRSRVGRFLMMFPLLAAALFIVGLARPQIHKGSSEVQASGVDLMLAIDVSGSMQSLDYKVDDQPTSRIAVVKAAVSKFIDARPDDRLGLIEFSAEPYLVSPLTLDHDWVRQGLERVNTGTIDDGTAIGSAIAMCVNRLRDQPSKSKVIVLLTDGENNMGKISPLLAAETAKALGVKIYTIGAGVRGDAPFPMKDQFGNTHIVMVPSDVDEKTLNKIAEETGGKFFRATDTQALDDVYSEIDHMEKTTRTVKHYEHVSELFAWAVVPGLLMLGSAFWLEQTRYRRLP
jgi:Ca-activated chloride channel family protein